MCRGQWAGLPVFVFRLAFVAVLVAGRLAVAADEHFGIPQVRFINEQIAAGWADAGLQPSAAATDGESRRPKSCSGS
jgi:hypothetical protein